MATDKPSQIILDIDTLTSDFRRVLTLPSGCN